jgi:hypothetical protein
MTLRPIGRQGSLRSFFLAGRLPHTVAVRLPATLGLTTTPERRTHFHDPIPRFLPLRQSHLHRSKRSASSCGLSLHALPCHDWRSLRNLRRGQSS